MKYIEKIDSYENESTYVKSCFSAMRTIAANPDFVADSFEKKSYILERNYILTMVYLVIILLCSYSIDFQLFIFV